jgi:hypothetical protein
MAGIREDAVFVVRLAKYGPCSSSPMWPGGCSPMGPIPRRAGLDDASGRIGASQREELGRVPRHRTPSRWVGTRR